MPDAYMVVTCRAIKGPEALAAHAKITGPAVEKVFEVLGEDAVERDMRIVQGVD